MYRRVFLIVIAYVLATSSSPRAETQQRPWLGAWRASPSRTTPVEPLRSYPATLQGYTIRQTIHLAAGGRVYRVRLDNSLTNGRTTISEVRAAMPGARPGSTDPASEMAVTFGGQVSVTIPAFASVLSDPVPPTVAAGSDVVVSMYVALASGSLTEHEIAAATGYVAPGNETRASILSDTKITRARILLSGVDVAGDPRGGTIVALGDSITDGAGSTPDTNHRWPDMLATRLKSDTRLAPLEVVNAGISGNRLLRDSIGPSALSRLSRDVLTVPSLRYICVLEGINDIAAGAAKSDPADRVTAADLIAGYRQVIAQAHEVGVKVLLGTITPFSGKGVAENTREQVNRWIRTSREFDGVLDFDAALRDPSAKTHLMTGYDSGDHIHPNDAGYAAMARSIDLDLFRASGSGEHGTR